MLDNLIKKYKKNDIEGIVYRLSYAGKYIIIKGNTLAGSLIIISNTFRQYDPSNKRFDNHLYKHLYDHYLSNEGSRFRIKTLSKSDHYNLLKREQMEIDKGMYNPSMLNNATEAYVPLYNELSGMYGWIPKTAVMNFKKWLNSKEREAYIKRYSKKPDQVLAKSGL